MAFRFDKLTIKAQEAIQRGQELAADAGNPQIESLHLLAALLAEQEGVVRPLLDRIGANQAQLQQIVVAELGHLPKTSGGAPPQLSAELAKVLEAAQRQAETMQDEFVSTEHLFLALAITKTKAQDVLKLNAISEQQILDSLKEVRGSARVTDQN
ncbi:MAG: ATP-dependent chaperone ClpB, partial [Planctomycetales bacterium]|nr:ATP-dependent chaperone ClpB [Planctomycetales bacterium]